MTPRNQDNMTLFSIQGFTDIPEHQLPFFLIFLTIYCIILYANITVFVAIWGDSQLHTPMYMFLSNLSIIDIVSSSNILPRLLNILLSQHNTISFLQCITQMYVFLSLECTVLLLLAVMAYDRYVAICYPLHYVILMSLKHAFVFAIISWTIGFLDPLGHAVLISKMSFCSSHLIHHFFCDLTPLLKLSCSDTFNVDILNLLDGTIIAFPAFLFTLISYLFIISTILKVKSTEGRHKAFSTCTSHLICVILFYGTLMCLYMRPASNYSPKQDRYFALLYIVLIPLLNPIVYSLKNKDVIQALKRLKNSVPYCGNPNV
ncbi:olfactory receptor 5AR1-like [Pelodytes ibericus]